MAPSVVPLAIAGSVALAVTAWYVLPRIVFDPIVRRMLRPPLRPPKPLPADLAARAEDVTIPARYLPIKGWLLRPDGRARGVVVFVHGWSSDGGRMAALARPSLAGGIACLLVDLPGHGRTGPIDTYNAARIQDDIASVGSWISSRTGLEGLPAGLLGYSFGGLAAVVAAGRDARWRGAATLAAPSSPMRATEIYFSARGLPGVLLGRALKRSLVRVVGIDPDEYDGPRSLVSIAVPVMIVHGAEDRVVPAEEARILAGSVPVGLGDLVIVEGQGHNELLDDSGIAERVAAFFEAALARRRGTDATPAAR